MSNAHIGKFQTTQEKPISYVDIVGVTGSIPVAPTIYPAENKDFFGPTPERAEFLFFSGAPRGHPEATFRELWVRRQTGRGHLLPRPW